MAKITAKVAGFKNVTTAGQSATQTASALRSLKDQINAQTKSYGVTQGVVPTLKSGDQTVRFTGSGLTLGMSDGKKTREVSISSDVGNYVDYSESTAAPTTSDLPNDGSWGWHKNTATSNLYLARNIGGTITYMDLVSIAGNISVAQHGDLSANGSTFHKFASITGSITVSQHGDLSANGSTFHRFPSITGSITATQHGDLSANGSTFHQFTSITGSITDDQHGGRGRKTSGGTAHHTNASASEPGFLGTVHYQMLVDATNSPTADTLVLRSPAGRVNAAGFNVDGLQVINARATGWGLPTGTQTRAVLSLTANAFYVQADFDTIINTLRALINDLHSDGAEHKLIGT